MHVSITPLQLLLKHREPCTNCSYVVGMMGYGQGNQSTAGIHFRQRARAIVVEDKQSHKLIAYVNLDICFTTMLVKSRVLAQLNKVPQTNNPD